MQGIHLLTGKIYNMLKRNSFVYILVLYMGHLNEKVRILFDHIYFHQTCSMKQNTVAVTYK